MLNVRNPNAEELSVDEARADLKVEDVDVGRARLAEPLRVPAHGQGVATLIARADWSAPCARRSRRPSARRPSRRRPDGSLRGHGDGVPVRRVSRAVRAQRRVRMAATRRPSDDAALHQDAGPRQRLRRRRRRAPARRPRRRRRSARSPTAASASAATRCCVVERARGDADFRYRIFNADGGEVEQCGNGARCFVEFVRDHGLTDKREIRVETAGGVIAPRLEADGAGDRRHGRAALRGRRTCRSSAARARSRSRSTSTARRCASRRCRWAIRMRCRSSPTSTPRPVHDAGAAHRAPPALPEPRERGLHAGRRSRYHSPARVGARRRRDARLRNRRVRGGRRGHPARAARLAGARAHARRRARDRAGRAKARRC